MKKIVKIAAAATLAGMAFSASAWWGGPWGGGPWGGGPWGGPWGGYYPYYGYGYGYAPVLVAPPVLPADMSDPFGDMPDTSAMDAEREQRMKESDAAREAAKAASAARSAEFRKAAEARRAEMQASSNAWRQQMDTAAPYGAEPYFSPWGPMPAPLAAPAKGE